MAKDNKLRGKPASKLSRAPKSLSPSKPRKNAAGTKKKSKRSNDREKPNTEKKEWEEANCSVCMEFPHNAVLLLCSSYEKGCRPYMCATSRRYSNCLDQYKKAYTKIANDNDFGSAEKNGVSELMCPLCRGQVKGWTVVDPARKYLNAKKRTCMQDGCKFSGTYRELRRHVKGKHPLARPRAVDPVLEEKWKRLEVDRERRDVISTIVSSTPGAVVLGDYVLEPNNQGSEDDDDFYSDDFDSDIEGDGELGGFDFGSLDILRFGGDNVRPRRFGLSSFIGGVSGRSLRRSNVFSRRRWRLR